MKTKHVLVIGGYDHTIIKLKKLNVAYSMVQLPKAVTNIQYQNAIRYAVMDYKNIDEVIAIARIWHEYFPFDAVISFTEYGLLSASECALALNILGNNMTAVQYTRDKIKMRELLNTHTLSTVKYKACYSMEDAQEFMNQLDNQPIILKPHNGMLSEGVYLVEDVTQIPGTWRLVQEATADVILAEEYISGKEYSVEAISLFGKHDIAMITEKIKTNPPKFIEIGHQAPAAISTEDLQKIKTVVIQFLDLIGQQTGPTHTEIRLSPQGVKIIESQTRIGGDQIWELCELTTGVDLISETITALLKITMPERIPTATAAAIRFFAFENKYIKAIHKLDEIQSMNGIQRVVCNLVPGMILNELTSSNSRQGYILCIGDTLNDAVLNAEKALNHIQIES